MLPYSLLLLSVAAERWGRDGAWSDAGKSHFLAFSADVETFISPALPGNCSPLEGAARSWAVSRSLQQGRDGAAAVSSGVLALPPTQLWQHPWDLLQGHLCLLYFGRRKAEFPEWLSQRWQVTGKLLFCWERWRSVGAIHFIRVNRSIREAALGMT